ncbi:hypothetical protein [Arthrobacter caoxuetaonis]|uniref:Uncharacterized protein n=1 Tax=Arthrobacter caoxuetaonis TaxID=2886935 RepID=A0A9X1ME13_9MICC|nr:hypothetical protein [Arthrobacter caoxuetaonis]MCC3297247.1 hypothetical protein [Arthrobacter caoxuetaonis]USQ58196.1 hypothetical protein NF551_05000 [Arthrobacter caoxuetaonis]
MPGLLRGTRGFVLAGLFLSALLVGGGILLSSLAGPAPEDPAANSRGPGPGAAPGRESDGGQEADPGQEPGSNAGEESAAAPNTQPPAAVPDPERPLEVPPGSAGNAAGPLPASRDVPEPMTLISLPLPPADAAEGRLAGGFPEQLVPPAHATEVVSSSVAASGNTLQAGLRATSAAAARDVLAFYSEHFSGLGFQPGAEETVGGTTRAVWSYGTSSVTLSIGPDAGGAALDYSIFAILRAGI